MTLGFRQQVVNPLVRFRRIGFEALAVGTGQAVGAAGSVVGVRILTELLPPGEYGRLALAMTVGTLGLQTLLAPLATSALRFYPPAVEAGDVRGFLNAVRKLLTEASGIVAAIMIVTVAALALVGRVSWIAVAVASFVFTLLVGAASVADGIQNAARHRVVASSHSGLAPWLRVLAAVLIIHLASSATSAAAMTGYAAASAIILTSQFYFIRRQILPLATDRAPEDQRWYTAILRNSWPFATWGIFTWAQMASDRWALGIFANATEVGYYAVIYQLGFYPILTASMLVSQVLAPILFARAGDATDAKRVEHAVRLNARLTLMMIVFALAGAVVMIWIHPLIGRLLLASEYRGVTHYLPWVVLSGGLFATGQIAALFFMINNRPSALALPKIVTAIAGIAMNFAGAKWFGIAGVIGATLLFGVFFGSWVSIAAWREMRKERVA